ncbi:MAG: hypothetical protein Q8P81_02425, partial [Nanoarchaeota archaeon]|nr:hypothetical protein [Nanoarchaeota archaeon]
MGKLSTPEWIKEGFDSKDEWQQAKDLVPSSPKRGQTKEKSQGKKISAKKPGKKFKLKVCPKCRGSDVKVVL